MSEADIQTFLEQKGSYLADYHETRDSYIGPDNDVPVKGWRASRIIKQAAEWYGLNPQVILATLQKEQSLVTNPSPPQWALDWAMGYGCPDSSPCASYPGFAVQVDWGAWQLRWNMDLANSHDSRVSPYTTGNTVTIDDTPVYLGNGATASLYRYTPHFHGNQNFALFFEEWFSIPLFNPFGSLDSVSVSGPGELSVSGWAIDSDTSDAIDIHVYVDGQPRVAAPADGERPDVGQAFAGYGSGHGYDTVVTGVTPGTHEVCTYGINQPGSPGGNTLLGCGQVNVPVNPFGSLDSAASVAGGQVSVGGWVIDPDVDGPVQVHIYVDGQPVSQTTADRERSDIGAAYPGYGPDHGFSTSLGNLSAGSHTVCAYGINVGPGGNTLLGCKTSSVVIDPFGSVDSVEATVDGVSVSGWAIDSDATAAIDVHVYVDGQPRAVLTADWSRPDVGAAYPDFGSGHGFSVDISNIATGSHTVCAYGINVGPGGNALLGCRAVNVVNDPFGSLDRADFQLPDTLSVSGWAIDPNSHDPIDVHVYIDGQLRAAFTADQSRPDVGAAYPGWGPGHGFSTDIGGVTTGSHTVCAYGINVGPGGNALLGCRTVVVNSPIDPFGSLDDIIVEEQSAVAQYGKLTMDGWAIDPGTSSAISVHIYIDSQPRAVVTADQTRLDVWVAYPAYGPGHGFSANIENVASGAHSVCAYGINVGEGGNALLGCRQVTLE